MSASNYISYSVLIPDYELDGLWGKLLLASTIVEGTFEFFQIERDVKNIGRKPFDLKNMIKIMFFASIEKIESTETISTSAKYNFIYQALCDKITPESRTIRDYREIYNSIHHLILIFTLKVANELNLSSFNHISGDGTIKLACNSPFNTIKRKDVHLLIKHYMVKKLSKEELKKLRKPALKFLHNNKLNIDEKIEKLFYWLDKFDLTGQKSLPLNDPDARWMKTKDKGQKYKKLAYNIQVSVDTESKLICGIKVVQYPTDHYQIPELLDQTIENLQMIPSIFSADTIYATISNLFYLKQHNISARIPTREQSKRLINKINENPYHKDHFIFDEKENLYICPEKQELTPDGVYDAPPEKGGFNKKKILYSNYNSCKKCKNKSKCTKSTHRTITRYLHELSYEVEKIMDTPEGQKDYKKRCSTVESQNGTFKRIFHYDSLQITGLKKTQNLMFKIAAAYNTIRIFNIIHDNGWNINYIIDKIRLIAFDNYNGVNF